MSDFGDILGPAGLQKRLEDFAMPQGPAAKPFDKELDLHVDEGRDVVRNDAGGGEVTDRIADALQGVSDLQSEVKGKAEALARGENIELHDLMISMGKSDVAFSLMLEVRNKLLEAWEQISRSAV